MIFYYPHTYDVWVTFGPPGGNYQDTRPNGPMAFIRLVGVSRESSRWLVVFPRDIWRAGYADCFGNPQ